MRCEHHCGACRSSNRRRKWLDFDDYVGWLASSDQESRNRVCKRREPLQCRSPRRCRYTNAPQRSQRLDVAADYEKGDGEECCRCRALPGTGRPCERRDSPRGWCGSRSSLVAARQFNIVPALKHLAYCQMKAQDERSTKEGAVFWSARSRDPCGTGSALGGVRCQRF